MIFLINILMGSMINLYLWGYNYYFRFLSYIFSEIIRFRTVYAWKNNKLENITMKYYLDNYNGNDICLIIDHRYPSKIYFITEYSKIKDLRLTDDIIIKRNNVLFYKNDKLCDYPMSRLDNYYINMKQNEGPHIDIQTILKIFDYDCDYLKITKKGLIPRNIRIKLNELKYSDIYQ